MATTARVNFRRTLDRVDGLILLHRSLGRRGKPSREQQDLLRAAVVLALSALDAMIVECIIEKLPEATRRGVLGQRVEKWVKENPGRWLKMLAYDSPHDELAQFVSAELSMTAFQRPAMIEDYFNTILRFDVPWQVAGSRIDGKMSGDDLKTHLNRFSDRRNLIAHKGDVKSGKRTPEPITRRWVETHLTYVRVTGETICSELNRSFRTPTRASRRTTRVGEIAALNLSER
jgi:hypothetical protein